MKRPANADPSVLTLDLFAMLSEAPDGRAWDGEAEDLAAKVRALLRDEGWDEGTDPCVCAHPHIHHDGPIGSAGRAACAVPWCHCRAYYADENPEMHR